MTDELELPDRFLSRHGKAARERGGRLWFDCFACGEGSRNGSCAMDASDGGWICSRATCPGVGPDRIRKGSLGELRKALGESSKPRSGEQRTTRNLFSKTPANEPRRLAPSKPQPISEEPVPIIGDTQENLDVIGEAGAYTRNERGFAKETVEHFGLRVCRHHYSLELPGPPKRLVTYPNEPAFYFLTRRNGVIVSVEYRFKTGAKKPWKNLRSPGKSHYLWGLELCPESEKTLLLVEGRFDAMAAWQMGYTGGLASMPQGIGNLRWIENDFDRLEKFERIVIAVDMDADTRPDLSGYLDELVNRLGRHRCERMEMPEKDLNACMLAGWGKSEMGIALQAVRPFKLPGLYHSSEFELEVIRRFETRDAAGGLVGDATGIQYWDACIGGHAGGAYTVLAGYPGSGKTLHASNMARLLSKRDVPCLYIPLEEGALRAIEWMIQQELGRPPLSGKEAAETLSNIGYNVWWYSPRLSGKSDPEELKKPIEMFVRRYGGRHILLDNLTCVGGSLYENQAQEQFMKWFLYELLIPFNVHATILVHARKPDSTGKRSPFPTMHDIMGSAVIPALATSVVVCWRPDEDEVKDGDPEAVLAFEKSRESGFKGRVNLNFDRRSRTYSEAANQGKAYKRHRLGKQDTTDFGAGF